MADKPLLNLTRLGWAVALPVLMLASIGLACIHATDRGYLQSDSPDSAAAAPAMHENTSLVEQLVNTCGVYTLRQVGFLLTGFLLMLCALGPSYERIGRLAWPIYWFVIILLALLVIDRKIDLPLIPVKRDTRRWVELGPFGLQPSEFMKVALILALARYLRFRSSYRTWRGLVPPFLLTLLPMVLILFQPDLGTLLMLLPVLFSMLFIAGARLRHLATIVVLGVATLPVFYRYGMHDYQKTRIDVMLRQADPDEAWHMREGYQLRQSKVALGTGGLTGEGYGQGVFVQYSLLPERHNDFIFAIIGHQWGFAGCVVVLAAYALIVLMGVEVAMITNDPFGRLLVVGVIVMIATQALINVCMTVGLAPITGMTLPFVSYGGSSLWANFLALGLLLNVAKRRPLLIGRPPFKHDDDDE